MWMCYIRINIETEIKTFERDMKVKCIPVFKDAIFKIVKQKLTFKNFVTYVKDENSFGLKIKLKGND